MSANKLNLTHYNTFRVYVHDLCTYMCLSSQISHYSSHLSHVLDMSVSVLSVRMECHPCEDECPSSQGVVWRHLSRVMTVIRHCLRTWASTRVLTCRQMSVSTWVATSRPQHRSDIPRLWIVPVNRAPRHGCCQTWSSRACHRRPVQCRPLVELVDATPRKRRWPRQSWSPRRRRVTRTQRRSSPAVSTRKTIVPVQHPRNTRRHRLKL